MKTERYIPKPNLPCPPEVALRVVAGIAEGLATLHRQGIWHGAISIESVGIDSDTPIALAPPEGERNFAGTAASEDLTPPHLRRASVLQLPGEIDKAQAILDRSRLPLTPMLIDLYQLGTLLCRLLTGESVASYLRSPRVKSRVPEELQPFIDRALGYEEQDRFHGADEFLAAVQELEKSERYRRPDPQSILETPLHLDPASSAEDTEFVADGSTDSPKLPSDQGKHQRLQRLAHYEVVCCIGHGGMGDVYEGFERLLERTVALKVLPIELARHDEYVRRFYAEAAAAAKLIHPNIVEIYYIGQDQGLHFFAMQHIDGGSLSELLKRTPRLEVARVIEILEQILSGLALAHRKGLVHRDIKPGNILLDRTAKRAYLADFGLVKTVQLGTGLTASGVVLGTMEYISPEQGRGVPIDARSDLYSIGVLMFQMLTGRLPFTAESATALIFQHVYEQPPDLATLVPDIPESMRQVVSRLLAKEPDKRYATAEAILADLRAIREGTSLSVVPAAEESADELFEVRREASEAALYRPSAIVESPIFEGEARLSDELDTNTGRWQNRWLQLCDLFRPRIRQVFDRIQSTQLQVDGAVAEYERRKDRLQSLLRDADSVQRELEEQRDAWRQAKPGAEPGPSVLLAGLSTIERADPARYQRIADDLDERIVEQRRQMESMRLQAAKVNATLERLRSQRDVLNARLRIAHARIRIAGGQVVTPSPAIRKWARLGAYTTLVAVVFLVVLYPTALPSLFYWLTSPSQQEFQKPTNIAVTKPPRAEKSAPDKPLRDYLNVTEPVTAVAFSPDKQVLLVGGQGGKVRLLEPESGNVLRELDCHAESITGLAMSRDRQRVFTAAKVQDDRGEGLKFWDVTAGREILQQPGRGGSVLGLSYSEQGRFVAAMHINDRNTAASLKLWDSQTGAELRTINDIAPEAQFAVDDAGELLAYVDWRASRVKVLNLKTQEVISLPEIKDRILQLKFGVNSFHNHSELSIVSQVNLYIWSKTRRFTRLASIEPNDNELNANDPGNQKFTLSSVDTSGQYDVQVATATGSQVYVYHRDGRLIRALETPSEPVALELNQAKQQLISGSTKPPYLLAWSTAKPTEDSPPARLQPYQLRDAGLEHTANKTSSEPSEGNLLALGFGKTMQVVQATDAKAVKTYDGASNIISATSISRDGKTGAAGCIDGKVFVWDLASPQSKHQFDVAPNEPQRPYVAQLSLSPNGTLLLATSHDARSSYAGPARLWELPSGKERLGDFDAAMIFSGSISPNGDRYAICGMTQHDNKGLIIVYDAAAAREMHRLIGHNSPVTHVLLSLLETDRTRASAEENRKILSAGLGEVFLWHVNQAKMPQVLAIPDDLKNAVPAGVAFSSDGQLAAAILNQTVLVWNMRGDQIRRIDWTENGAGKLLNLAFLKMPDEVLATMGQNSIRHWDINEKTP